MGEGPTKPLDAWLEDDGDYRDRPDVADAPQPVGHAASADEVEVRATVVGPASHGQRLDRVLVSLAPEFSRNHLQGLVRGGHVCVDGEPATQSSRKLRLGQRLSVELIPTAQSLAYTPEPMRLHAVFEDEHVLVLNKPAGLVVHPAPGNWSGTLLNGLLARHRGAAALPRAGIVHRLDRDTSGLMVVGKTLAAVTALSRAIAAREVQREYLALAHGFVDPARQSIEAPIGRDPVSRVRMAVLASGRPARTDVIRLAAGGGMSALRCRLHSGRTHQIRVHLASRGHPLVADALYRGAAALGLQRQALHATRLVLRHPGDGRVLEFDCPLPPDLAPAWRAVAAG